MNRYSNLKIASVFFICSIFIAFVCVAQASITITSPTQGAVFTPGSSIQVTVDTGTDEFTSVGIGVNGPSPGPLKVLTSPPYQFIVPLPRDVLGKREITAFAVAAKGDGVFSDPVTIDVESDEPITSIEVMPTIINFSTVGEQIPINITGKFSDETVADLTNSSKIAYSVANTNVATVAPSGIVTAIGAGGTTVTATYDGLSLSVPILVPLGDATPIYKVVAIPQGTVTKDHFGNYLIKIKIVNNSNTRLWDISITGAVLNKTAAALIVPTSFTNTDPNTSEEVSLTFPPSAGAAKSTASLQLKGTYVGSLPNGQLSQPGALNFTLRIPLP